LTFGVLDEKDGVGCCAPVYDDPRINLLPFLITWLFCIPYQLKYPALLGIQDKVKEFE
jgi:hypothetical protein